MGDQMICDQTPSEDAATTGTPEEHPGPAADPSVVVAAARSALDQAGLSGSVSYSNHALQIVVPASQEDMLLKSEFNFYRTLASALPPDVYRAVRIDLDVEEEDDR